MKRILFSIVGTVAGMAVGAAALAATAYAEDSAADDATEQAGSGRLTLTVSNIESDQGAVMIGIYAGPDAYNSGDPVADMAAPVDGAELTAVFEGLAPGDYAIRLFHDINGDDALNTNSFGMPTEPYGFSNNARGFMGPASYEGAKFSIGAGETTHTVRLGG